MVVVVVVAAFGVVAVMVSARSVRSSRRLDASATVAAREALAMWRGFPAAANPRPIVVVGEGSVLDPALGFPNSADKIAWLTGRFTLATPLPTASSTSDGYPVISAAAAYRLLRSRGGKQKYPVTAPLSIDRVRLGQAVFDTDRGQVKLPAWQFWLAGVTRPGAVLALAAPDMYAPPALRELSNGVGESEDESATVSKNGKRLYVLFIGAPAGTKPCDASYAATAIGDANAVALIITAINAAAPRSTICSAVGYRRTAVAHLTHPLTGRVLIADTDGGAIPVTPRR
jgi:hypothetical protein